MRAFKLIRLVVFIAFMIGLKAAATTTTYTVNTTSDGAGVGTLRYAITSANALPTTDDAIIVFSVAGTFTLTSTPLPAIVRSIVLDGTSAPGYSSSANPVVVIDGGGVYANGLTIQKKSTIKGVYIKNFLNTGIEISTNLSRLSIIKEVVITNIGNGASTTIASGIHLSLTKEINISYCRIGNNFTSDAVTLGIEDYGIYFDHSVLTYVGGQSTGAEPDHLSKGATITNCGQDGVFMGPPNNSQHYIFKSPIYNCGQGIILTPGANTSTPAPVITSAAPTSASGTGLPFGEVQLYASTGPENANMYLGSTHVDGSGNWTVSGVSGTGYDNYCYYIAIQTRKVSNTLVNTGPMSTPFALNREACLCPYLTSIYGNNVLTLTAPSDFTMADQSADYLKATVLHAPPLQTVSQYTVYLMLAQTTLNSSSGVYLPDWQNPITYTTVTTYTYIPDNQVVLNTPISTYIASPPSQPTTYYWKVGLQYSADVAGHHVITWSTPYSFILSPAAQSIPASTYLTDDGQHTNDINWVYGVSYLDDGITSEGIAYIDGLGKSRQVQSKLNSENKIMAVEAAYSEEGGGTAMSLPAPIQSVSAGQFGYDYQFFDVFDGTQYHDFGTKDFDREVVQTGANVLMSPVAVSGTSSVAQYYSSSNSDAYVDDAEGYPYSYNVGYNNPLQRPMLSQAGVGATFKMTGGKEYKHFYGKPDSQAELDRVWGNASNKKRDKIARSITFDPNGIGYVTYKDNEGKVIATALSVCNAPSLEAPSEEGMGGFTQHVNAIDNDILNPSTNERIASSKFFIPCSTAVTLDYTVEATAFNFMGGTTGTTSVCMDCEYDVEINISNEATGQSVYTFTQTVTPSSTLCPGPNPPQTLHPVNTYTLSLNGPANYLFERKVHPHFDASSGNSSLTEAINTYTASVQSNSATYYAQFLDEFYTHDKYFVLRKEEVTNYNSNPGNNYSTTFYSSWYAGSGVSGSVNGLPLTSNTKYRYPTGVTLDPISGNLYVAEDNSGTSGTNQIRKIDGNGVPTTITTSSSINPNDICIYRVPNRILHTSIDMLLVSDKANDQIVMVDPSSGSTTVMAGSSDGIDGPEGMSEDPNNNCYISSTANNRVYRFTYYGDTSPSFDRMGQGLTFSQPSDVEQDPNSPNVLYICNRGTNQILKIDTTSGGSILDTYGSGSAGSTDDADASNATFNGPTSILYLNAFGTYTSPVLLVSDKGNDKIRVIELTGTNAVSTVSGLSSSGDVQGGPTLAKYHQPYGLTGVGNNMYLADASNNRIKRFHYNIANASPCTTSCYNDVYYPDEVQFNQLSGASYKISDLDGDPDGVCLPPLQIGDETYTITLTSSTPVLTSQSSGLPGTPTLYDDFVNAYASHHMMTTTQVYASIVSMDEIAVSSPTQIATLFQDHSLDNPNQTYHLLKVRIQDPDCGDQCAVPTSTVTCSTQCSEQLLALQSDVELGYTALSACTGHYQMNSSSSTLYTVQQLVNPFYPTAGTGGYQPLTAWQFGLLNTADANLYIDFENRMDALNLFDINSCLSLCNGASPDPCDACKPAYATCVMANLDELGSGIEYVVQNWDPLAPNTFPWTEDDLFSDYPTDHVPDPDIMLGLGKSLFDFIAGNVISGGISAYDQLNQWNTDDPGFSGTLGGSCSNCGNPVVTSGPNTYACTPPSQVPDLSGIPSFLIQVLETANEACDHEFNRCMAFASGNTATGNFLCQEDIANDCYVSTVAAHGQEPYPSNSGNSAWVTWNGYLQSCISGAAPCTASVAVDQYKADIIFNALATVYTGPNDNATIISTTSTILTSTVTPSTATLLDDGVSGMTIEQTQVFMQNYITELQCKLNCESALNSEYQEWLNQLMNTTINQIETNYYSQCIAGMNDVFTVSYNSSLYHYTLYNYDFANNLVSTVPPAGIDYINLLTTPNRQPDHTLASTYSNSSLYTLTAGSPDEVYTSMTQTVTTTRYFYDQAGRLRYSQSPEQVQRGVVTGKNIYSYIRYDNESRVIQTGEYRGPVPVTTTNLAANQSFPNFGNSTFDEILMAYDNSLLPANAPTSAYQQKYLQGRISAVINYASGSATYYSYDAHGRVTFSVQMYGGYGPGMQRYKTTDYTYKNLTSRVEQITFQKWNAQEEFIHKYEYDDDYRLVKTQVSRDGTTWADAAEYSYYTHGPVKRTSLGQKAQDMDFVYNINGWLKAINDPTAVTTAANAGNEGTSSPSTNYAPDVFAEVINYYRNDFIRTGVNMDASSRSVPQSGSTWEASQDDLFNGNISSTLSYTGFDLTSALRPGTTNGSTESIKPVLAQAYKYDYLNRLTKVYGEELVTTYTATSTATVTPGVNDVFATAITYDANGNIKSLQRNSYYRYLASVGSATTQMDNMTYKYDESLSNGTYSGRKKNNQLQYVYDAAANTAGGEDIQYDVAGTNNSAGTSYSYSLPATHKYVYDAKGRIIHDYESGVAISWNSFDKITAITSATRTITFKYNSQQQRVEKAVTQSGTTTTDYYAYDANGILMATYKKVTGSAMKLEEFHMYGQGRLGTYRVEEPITGNAPANPADYSKQYFEITDHLGSVRAVVKGKKVSCGGGCEKADIVQLTDYHEFGMGMQGRNYTAEAYRFGYQGSEKETGVNGMYTTEFRALDVRLGRWFMTDPMTNPGQSPYCSMDNNPIALTDVMGLNTIEQEGGGEGPGPGPGSDPTESCPYEDNGPHVLLPGGDFNTVFSYTQFYFNNYYSQVEIPHCPKMSYEGYEEVNVASDAQPDMIPQGVNALVNILNGLIDLCNKSLHPIESSKCEIMVVNKMADRSATFSYNTANYISKNSIDDMVSDFTSSITDWLTSSWEPCSNETREGVLSMIIMFPASELGGTGAVMEEINTELEMSNAAIVAPREEVIVEQTEQIAAEVLDVEKIMDTDALGTKLAGETLDEAKADLIADGWVEQGTDGGITTFTKTVGKDRYFLNWNARGQAHSINGGPTQYWKLYKGKQGNNNVIFRASKDKNFKPGGKGKTFTK